METQSVAHIFRGLMHLAVNASVNNACECKGGKRPLNGARDLAQGVWKNFGHGVAHYRLEVARYRLAAWTTAPASASRPAPP